MQILANVPATWTTTADGAIPAPGVALRIGAFQPLPLNLEAWRDAVLYHGLDRRTVRVVAAVDRTTHAGWPVALVVTEVGPVRRMHVFYRFLVYGVVAVLEGEAHAFDAVMEEVKEVALTARPDFTTERPLAASQVWAGFDLGSPAA